MDINRLDLKHLSSQERKEHVKSLPAEMEWAQGLVLGDEWANSLTHGLGLLMSLAGFFILLMNSWTSANHIKLLTLTIYGLTLVLLYMVSTLYHIVRNPSLKRLLRTLDHCAIYIFIAGTYTPFVRLVLEDPYGEFLFSVIWGLALLGVAFKIFCTHRFKKLSVTIYLSMGWLILAVAEPFYNSFPFEGICWLFAGGLSYTVGVIFYVLDGKKFFHAVWHLFVMGGSVCHYAAALLYL